MGMNGILPYYRPGSYNVDASPDIHTGRQAYLLTGNASTALLTFQFDEEQPSSPARIVPYLPVTSFSPGVNLDLVNAGGDWATDVTITSITATNGVTLAL